MNRRTFLASAAAAHAGLATDAESAARDEDFWRPIQLSFDLDRNIIDLNHGGVCPSPQSVQEALFRYLRVSNQAPVYTMWRLLEPELEEVRRRLAASVGCEAEELAVTRSATEALEICQLGIDLARGDEVLATDQDYPRMLDTWRQRERREGVVLRTIRLPAPDEPDAAIVRQFERAITSRTRAILISHITYTTGRILPVGSVCRMARERGIQTIVDGAHAFGHVPFQMRDVGCDYYGTSLHKWLLAPHGTGFLFVRKDRIAKLWPLTPAAAELKANIRKFEQVGTHPAANHNAIADALLFHESIGGERKLARLRYLRDRWVNRLRSRRGAELLTPLEAGRSGGIALISFDGKDPAKLVSELWNRRRILVTNILREDFQGIRVSPNICTTLEEVDAFCEAMETLID